MNEQQYALEPVQFQGDTIFAIEFNGEPYAAVKPIVENMGIDWPRQSVKLNDNKERWSVAIMATVAADGKTREMVCIPIRKISGFLATINPGKVKPDLRPKIHAYQNECDNALHDYWTKGRAVNRRAFKSRYANEPYLSNEDIANMLKAARQHETATRIVTSEIKFHLQQGVPLRRARELSVQTVLERTGLDYAYSLAAAEAAHGRPINEAVANVNPAQFLDSLLAIKINDRSIRESCRVKAVLTEEELSAMQVNGFKPTAYGLFIRPSEAFPLIRGLYPDVNEKDAGQILIKIPGACKTIGRLSGVTCRGVEIPASIIEGEVA